MWKGSAVKIKGWMKGGGEANMRALRLHRSTLLVIFHFYAAFIPSFRFCYQKKDLFSLNESTGFQTYGL
jgi:hypothetical protein